MSTKIYYAWRVKHKDLERFIEEFRNHVFNAGVDYVNNLVADNPKEPPSHIIENIGLEKARRVMEIREIVKTLYKDSLARYPLFDMGCGLRIFLDGTYFNILPWGGYHFYKDFSSEVGKDWSYWNNSDRPDDISSREWKRREASWGSVNESYSILCNVLGIKEWRDRYEFFRFYGNKMELSFEGLEFVKEFELEIRHYINSIRKVLEHKTFDPEWKTSTLETLDQIEIKLKLKD